MGTERNRRVHTRYHHQAEIMFSYFFENPNCFYGAQMKDTSDGGIFFMSNYLLELGSILSIKRTKYRLEIIEHENRKTERYCVVRCRKLNGDDNGHTMYGIGAKRLDEKTITQGEKLDVDDDYALPKTSCGNPDCERVTTLCKRLSNLSDSMTQDLSALNRFALAITSTLELQSILKIICEEMVKIFDARNTGIGLLNKEKTSLNLVSFFSTGDSESDATGLEIPIVGNAASISVVESGQTIVVPDAQHNPITKSYHDIAHLRGTHCIMIVPLIARGEVIGTIGLPTSDPKRIYNSADVALAQTIASQISSVIENARLYEETEKAKDEAEHELEIGREIQMGFFPDTLPDIPGLEIAVHFQAARQVAGDFYDAFTIEDNKLLAFVVADVCDKGVGAALFMALFRSLIRASAVHKFANRISDGDQSYPNPADILYHTMRLTNDYIATTHDRTHMFATVFFGILKPETGELTYVNCGHQAPLVIDNRRIRTKLNPTSPAVGMFPGINIETDSIQLGFEEILFICTDGVTDAMNQTGEFFSDARLLKLLREPFQSAEQVVDAVKMNVAHHVENMDPFDDVTIMTIRRMKSVA
jgi:sigma-B regulation protein RsbU (phosphoserine phosphatase)